MDFKSLLSADFAPYRALSRTQLDALAAHYELLLKWNRKLNLCRFRDLAEAVDLHYCESLYLGISLPSGPLQIVDVGSGSGFPGIPIGILRPECRLTLIDSDKRKAAFLREACHGRTNFRIIAERAEDVSERYDWIVSRAVTAETVRRLRVAPNCALLTSTPTSVKLPWGEKRFIQMFHVEL